QRRMAGGMAEGPLVVRWMLNPRLEYEEAVQRYQPFSELVDEDPATRETLAALCVEEASRGREVFIVANNKAEGSAPLSVFELAAAIAGRPRRIL
nr:DUF72 domain-containing protein [Acidobacteriota bacterium]NIQ31429.1 DUF72 domain-containing protein [Acidobacteriota bacterium]NIQ85761.1 DUF72 domain-containing protein [Acidobacteriota bacterium]